MSTSKNTDMPAVSDQMKLRVLSIGFVLLFVAVACLAWYVLDAGPVAESDKQVITEQVYEQAKRSFVAEGGVDNTDPDKIVKQVSAHMLLPEGEIVVATVQDEAVLKEQNPIFFQYTKKGDKLLFYPLGIIVYDPVEDKIVDVLRHYPEN